MGRILNVGLAWIVVAAFVLIGEAFAQTTVPNAPVLESSLSAADRAAISTILGALLTQKGDALNQTVVGALDGPGVDAAAVARAVKLAAGSNLPNFQSILIRGCLGGGSRYCTLASLQAPSSPGSDVQTAATSSSGDGNGAAAGGGGGAGGTPQVNQGHNGSSFASGSLFDASGLDLNSQNFGRSFFSSSTPSIVSTSAASPTISAPGPVAGTGLPIVFAIFGGLLWRRRRRSPSRK